MTGSDVIAAARQALCLQAFVAGAVLCALHPAAEAHDTWLSRHAAPSGGTQLRLTTGHRYPTPETPVRPERVAQARFRRGRVEGLATLGEAKTEVGYTALQLPPDMDAHSGVSTQVGVSLFPLRIEIKEPTVTKYLDEVACEGAARLAWEQRASGVPWLEEYSKHAVCWINGPRVDAGPTAATQAFAAQPFGFTLELLPQVDPGSCRPGDRFRVLALRRGQPMQGLALFLADAAGSPAVLQHTDATGCASWTLSSPGQHLVKGTHIRPPDSEGVWHSDFSTLSFEVRA